MNYTTCTVTEKNVLDTLYEKSALTVEGIAESSIPDFVEWLKNNTTFTTETLTVYVIKGSVMNKEYNLTDNNKYPDDLTLVSVCDIDLMKVVMGRFAIGGRWFDDIVDNNARRETEKKMNGLW